MVSTLKVCCSSSECGKASHISNPYSPKAKSLNARSVLAMREIGRGHSYMKTFFGLMDMLPPVTPRSFNIHNRALAEASMSAAMDNMIAASDYLHHLHGVDSDEILDIKVTCDGTWFRRGFTAIHGVVAVISYDTGQVLDFEVLSKSSTACAQKKSLMYGWMGTRRFAVLTMMVLPQPWNVLEPSHSGRDQLRPAVSDTRK